MARVRREEDLVETAQERVIVIEGPVTEEPEHLFPKRVFLDPIVIVKPSLRSQQIWSVDHTFLRDHSMRADSSGQ